MADDFDDYFDDDGTLDALADHELQALEEAAVKSTQQWSTSQAAQQSRSYEQQPPVQRRNPQIPPQNHQHQQPTPRPEHSAPHRIPNQRGQYQQATRPETYISYTKSQREQSQPRNTTGAYPQQTARPKATYNQTYVEEATLPFATVPTIPQHGPPAVPDKPSSDYGDFEFEEESELLDTAAPTNADQYQDLRGASSDETLNHNHASRYHGYHNAYGGPTNAEPGYDANGIWLQDGQVYDNGIGVEQMDYEQAPLGDPVDIQQLRDRVAQYEAEKNNLAEQLEKAKAQELLKTGEVSIVRENMKKASKEHDRIIASLKQIQAEQREAHHKEIEMLRESMSKLETEMSFLKKDLEELTRTNRILDSKNKALQRQRSYMTQSQANHTDSMNDVVMSGTSEAPSVHEMGFAIERATTPKKKGKSYAHRDGFDDAEMAIMSPTSSKRGKQRTPVKAGSKRKRQNNDSPVMQLPLSAPRTFMVEDRPLLIDDRTLESLWAKAQDDRVESFEALMVHRFPGTGQRSIDSLASFSFPSSPETTLSGFFFDQIALLKADTLASAVPVTVCRALLAIWRRCLDEKFYDAISIILDLVRFCVLWSQGSFCFDIMDEAVSLIQTTVDLNTIPTFRQEWDKLEPGVDGVACLKLLEDIVLSVLPKEKQIQRFWRLMRSDFALLIFCIRQPLDLMLSMASILCTSASDESFGPCTTVEDAQRENEQTLLSSITQLLITTPKQPDSEEQYTDSQILRLRTEIIQFLGSLAGVESGKRALVNNKDALPRISRRISEEVDELYEWRRGEALRTHFINNAVRLMFTVIAVDPAACRPKIMVGMIGHRHLVSMGRLAFSEGHAQEKGIEDDVSQKAHDMLEGILTPHEAEELPAIFEQNPLDDDDDEAMQA